MRVSWRLPAVTLGAQRTADCYRELFRVTLAPGLGELPRTIPAALPVRVALGPAFRSVTGRADSLLIVGVEGAVPATPPLGFGVLVGLPVALACARLIRGQLYGVEWVDPKAIGAALVTMALSAMLAVLVLAAGSALLFPLIGAELFPKVDSGQFSIQMRPIRHAD